MIQLLVLTDVGHLLCFNVSTENLKSDHICLFRLYSLYKYKYQILQPDDKPSATDFHSKVVRLVAQQKVCLKKRSIRSCAYDTSIPHTIRKEKVGNPCSMPAHLHLQLVASESSFE